MALVRFAISVQLVVLACLTLVSACGYDDRSYDGIVFACDGAHPCPDGVACVNGQCAGSGSGSGSNSAKLGVACGAQQCPLGMGCCNDLLGPLYCVPLGGCDTGAQQEVQCDGKEDCTGGRNCCLDGAGTRCEIGTCGAAPLICSSTADCPGDAPFCCTLPVLDVPLKHCQPVSCQ